MPDPTSPAETSDAQPDAPSDPLKPIHDEMYDIANALNTTNYLRGKQLRELGHKLASALAAHDARVEARARLATIERCAKYVEALASDDGLIQDPDLFEVGDRLRELAQLEREAVLGGQQ